MARRRKGKICCDCGKSTVFPNGKEFTCVECGTTQPLEGK